ncbi:hypothetical protein JW992_03750 [candidate division KSB1 bacterium]|nr:hypothetical protein [candidate division KSB1 bacterium]
MHLHPLDAAIVLFYFVMMLVIGVFMERRAGKNLDSYFLGNRKMPWWVLGMSGSSTFFDIAGTMWMVSTFYVLGMRGWWVHWLWCFPFAGFVMAFKAKWAFRSGVLTGMEWLVFRFGHDRAGQAARLTAVIINVILLTVMLGYAGTGVGLFMEEFFTLDKNTAIPILFVITGLYVLLGGFFSVVYSDLVQTLLLSFAAIYIAVNAFLQIDALALREIVGTDWFSLAPVWRLEPAPREFPQIFGLLILLWVTKGIMHLFMAPGGADFQRFRAARNEAEASKIGLAWGTVISIRWALVMALTVFGLTLFNTSGGMVDSERVLPMVINRILPVGIKGLVLAGLMAAFMSTFDSGLNVAASYIVNDLVKPVWKDATPKQLIWISYASTILLIAIGILISRNTETIRDIWNPINFALGSALIAPTLLAPYWWRLGGWAYCLSGLVTLPVAFAIHIGTTWSELVYFPILAGLNLTVCIAGGFLLQPASETVLFNYYRRIRPFGWWAPIRRRLLQRGESADRPVRDRLDLPIAVIATLFFISLYILMMDLVLHNWPRAAALAAIVGILALVLYKWWYRFLEPANEKIDSLL